MTEEEIDSSTDSREPGRGGQSINGTQLVFTARFGKPGAGNRGAEEFTAPGNWKVVSCPASSEEVLACVVTR